VHNDGLNSVVQWDHYSIIVNGRRLFVFAGEWHYWRLPVPEMWVDILQKIKSAGFTGFTFYSNWGYHAPNSTTLDFTNGAHNFTLLYTIAKELGLYDPDQTRSRRQRRGNSRWLSTLADHRRPRHPS